MKLNITHIEYIQEPLCNSSYKQQCPCTTSLIYYIKNESIWNFNPALSKKIIKKPNGGTAFKGCGKANQIIGLTIDNIEELCNKHNTTVEGLINHNESLLSKVVKKLDPYLEAISHKRHHDISRLDIIVKRWISAEDKQKIIQWMNFI